MKKWSAAALVLASLLVAAPPAGADDDQHYVDLVVTAALDKDAYVSTDRPRLTVTVTNAGTVTATDVRMTVSGTLGFHWSDWGVLDPTVSGPTLRAGESVTVSATGVAQGVDRIEERISVRTWLPDRDPATNEVVVGAPLTVLRGDVAGLLYGERDGDHVAEPGEGLPDVDIRITGGAGALDFVVGTDAGGRFTVPDLPTGTYSLFVGTPNPWRTETNQTFDVAVGDNTVLIRAFRNEIAALSATVRLDRDTYAPGDTVHEHITLTNTGTNDLVGLFAVCGSWNYGSWLPGAGWGDLEPGAGPGLRLPAGETVSFEFAEPLPATALAHGYVALSCRFTDSFDADGVLAEDVASVPGGRGPLTGTIVRLDDQVLAGVTVLLTEPASGAVAARVVTDALGRFAFASVPAGRYELRVLGPWQPADVPVLIVQVLADTPQDLGVVRMAAGPLQLDPEASPAAPDEPGGPPAPRAAPRPVTLADTGASVVAPAALGLLLVLVGAALVLVPRRRST